MVYGIHVHVNDIVLCCETTVSSWPPPFTFPLLKALNETRIWFHAGPLALDEGICSVERHVVISNQVGDHDGCAP